MAELIAPTFSGIFGTPTLPPAPEILGAPAVIIPKPFNLSDYSDADLGRLSGEVTEKQLAFETAFSIFYQEWHEYAQSWRVQPRQTGSKKPFGLFNSKSGETNRAANTLATLWQRMLTADDKFFEARAEGFDDMGQAISEADLYGVENVLQKQLRAAHFKRKLLKSLRSTALFGTCIVENPFVSLPYGGGRKTIQFTDFVLRSLLLAYFDPTVFDIECSDWIAFTDFPTKHRLMNYASADPETWNETLIEKAIDGIGKGSSNQGGGGNAFNRFLQRRQRAGYSDLAMPVVDMTTYHGRLSREVLESEVVKRYWESTGLEDEPKYSDFTVGVVGQGVVRFHRTPYGTWHHVAKIAHACEFELEPIGYGVGRFGKGYQKELDTVQSRAGDILAFSLYNMWKVGRYAGIKPNQLTIKPNFMVEMEDITQMEPIRPEIEALSQAIAMMGGWKEDFRAITGATANLQAAITKATATEASITQTEAIRSNSVVAELIAETFIREYLETCHINNLDNLDEEIWVNVGGIEPLRSYSRNNLPINIGFEVKVTSDKDFRPERLQKLIEFYQIWTSIRQMQPGEYSLDWIMDEIAHGFGVDPRRLRQPGNMQAQLMNQMRQAKLQQFPQLLNENQGEMAAEMAGDQGGFNNISTPVGPVPTSPASPPLDI